jgi:hypothetical protein
MKRKSVQISEKAHKIIQKEAVRESMKHGYAVTIGMVIGQFAEKLQKLRGRK